ncbi:MAG: hypothetical protein K6L60_09795 [Oceanobacter sp.]
MKTRLGLDANLPVTDIVSEAIKLIWLQSGFVLSRFFPFMLALALIDWLGKVLFPEQAGLMPMVFMLLSMLLGVVFAIACHRFALADQDVPIQFKWSRDHWRYLWRGVQIGLVGGLVLMVALIGFGMVAPGLLSAQGGAEAQLSGPAIGIALVGLMLMLYVTSRLSVTLPEIAIGRPSSLKRAWKLSNGNGSRLVVVVWIVPIVLALPFMAAYLLESSLMLFVAGMGAYIATLISLITLSLSYRFLVDLERESSPEKTDGDDSGFSA